jgi:hypothetical protein
VTGNDQTKPASCASGARPNHRRPRGLAFALAICGALVLTSCESAPKHHGLQDEDYSVEQETKSVWIGELLAIFPGLLWHGIGHRYAGDKEKASEIEMIEAYSLLAGGAGVGLVIATHDEDNLMGLEITGWTIGGLGGLMFVGSWLYDVIFTPAAIERYNDGIRGKPASSKSK